MPRRGFPFWLRAMGAPEVYEWQDCWLEGRERVLIISWHIFTILTGNFRAITDSIALFNLWGGL